MTGNYPHKHGVMGLAHRGWSLNDDQTTLPDCLEELGYTTNLVGFQHEARDPERLGYEHIYDDSVKALDLAETMDDIVTELADDQPFFASVGFTEPHRPYRREYVPDGAYEAVDPGEVEVPPYLPDQEGVREDLADFEALVSYTVDRAVGKIRETLAEADLMEDTLILFTTDHGIAMPRAKGTLYDPGVGTALVMYREDEIEGGEEYDELLSNVDLLPTLVELAGGEAPEDIDGRSFHELLTDDSFEPREEIYMEMTWHDRYNPVRAVRTDEYKYIRNFWDGSGVFMPLDVFGSRAGEEVREQYFLSKRLEEEFYDLGLDPWEQENLAPDGAIFEERAEAETGEVLEQLRSDLLDWMRETDDPLLEGPVPPANGPDSWA